MEELEDRVRKIENWRTGMEVEFRAHARELTDVKTRITNMDEKRLTPMQGQLAEIHQCMSRDTGFRDGKAHIRGRHMAVFMSAVALVSVLVAIWQTVGA